VGAQWQNADIEWQLKRDRHGTQVFLSKMTDSRFRAVLSVMVLKTDAKQLTVLVMDFEN
jgi:hypothetical protein